MQNYDVPAKSLLSRAVRIYIVRTTQQISPPMTEQRSRAHDMILHFYVCQFKAVSFFFLNFLQHLTFTTPYKDVIGHVVCYYLLAFT